jgi:hypothetical protein
MPVSDEATNPSRFVGLSRVYVELDLRRKGESMADDITDDEADEEVDERQTLIELLEQIGVVVCRIIDYVESDSVKNEGRLKHAFSELGGIIYDNFERR